MAKNQAKFAATRGTNRLHSFEYIFFVTMALHLQLI